MNYRLTPRGSILAWLKYSVIAVVALVNHVDLARIAVLEHKEIMIQHVHLQDRFLRAHGAKPELLALNDIVSALILSGAVFVTSSGKPVDSSNIRKEMKKLSELAKVNKQKIFPHNFRHFFARTFYSQTMDIVRLADILGHSSVDTTRIYTMKSGAAHRRQLEKLNLVKYA